MCVPKYILSRWQVCRKGKIHRNIPLRTSITGKTQSFVLSTPFLLLPHKAELEGKSLYVGIGEGKVVVGKLMSAAPEDSKSHKHTHMDRAQQWGDDERIGCDPPVYFWPGMERQSWKHQRQAETTWELLQGCSDPGGCYCERGLHNAVRCNLYPWANWGDGQHCCFQGGVEHYGRASGEDC